MYLGRKWHVVNRQKDAPASRSTITLARGETLVGNVGHHPLFTANWVPNPSKGLRESPVGLLPNVEMLYRGMGHGSPEEWSPRVSIHGGQWYDEGLAMEQSAIVGGTRWIENFIRLTGMRRCGTR